LAGEVDRTKKRIQGFASVKPIKARVIPPNRLPPYASTPFRVVLWCVVSLCNLHICFLLARSSGEAPNWLKEGFISFEVINTVTKRVAFGIKGALTSPSSHLMATWWLTSVMIAGDYELPVRNMAETNLNWHVDKDNEDEAGEKKANTLLLRIERGKLARVRFVHFLIHALFVPLRESRFPLLTDRSSVMVGSFSMSRLSSLPDQQARERPFATSPSALARVRKIRARRTTPNLPSCSARRRGRRRKRPSK